MELVGGQGIYLAKDYPPEDLADFQNGDERGRNEPSPGIAGDFRPKNVILVALESVGIQHLQLYGSPYATMPNLTAEAASHGMSFDNIYAHVGQSANSLLAMTLSKYPKMSWRECSVEQPDMLGTSLASLMHETGHRTAYITSADNRYANNDQFLLNRGYDDIWDYRAMPGENLLFSWGVEDRCLIDAMIRWIDRGRDKPFFLMAWTEATHHPYQLAPGQPVIDFFPDKQHLPADESDLGKYLNTLVEADRQLGRLFEALRERGLADDTLVVITGDHGEAFGSPHKTYGHGGKLFEENLHVPLVLWNPRLFHGERRSVIGGHIDVNPTILNIVTPHVPIPAAWQGRSLFEEQRTGALIFTQPIMIICWGFGSRT